MSSEVAGTAVSVLLLVFCVVGAISCWRRFRGMVVALHVANVNRNRIKTEATSTAQAAVDFGGVHVNLGPSMGSGASYDLGAIGAVDTDRAEQLLIQLGYVVLPPSLEINEAVKEVAAWEQRNGAE